MARTYRLTHDTLLTVLDYDPGTGIFVWKVARSNRVKIGSRAGVLHQASGGRYISIDGEKFMAHRLAFFFVNKRWPNTDVRPNDGDYDNCAIANLTEVSRVELAHKREGVVGNNTSGFAGVSKTNKGKWQASITWNYKQISLGANFETAEAASEVRVEAERRLALTKTDAEQDRALEELRVWKGQRTAWRYLAREYSEHGWASFEEFAAEITDVPVMRYALSPVDFTRPIGPGNYRWAFPDGVKRSAGAGQSWKFNRDRERDRHLQRMYGITLGDYERMLAAQGGVCAICEGVETKKVLNGDDVRQLCVDHDHATGKVRAVLCSGCNNFIGYAKEDKVRLHRAISYLARHTEADTLLALDHAAEYVGITVIPLSDRLRLMEAAGNG